MTQEYDFFISFKNLGADGKPTRDSELAADLYRFLSTKGLTVFLSNISLEKLGVDQFKKAIDDALDASGTLVAVGTSQENLNSQWVRYEWDSFYNDILSGLKPKGRVFAFVEGIDTSALPRALRQSQTFMNIPGSLDQLCNFIANALEKPPTDPVASADEQASAEAPSSSSSATANITSTSEIFVVIEKSGTEHQLSELSINYSTGMGPGRERRGIKLKRGSAEVLMEWARLDTLTFVRSSKEKGGKYHYEVQVKMRDGKELTMDVVDDWSMVAFFSDKKGILFGQHDILGELSIEFCNIEKIICRRLLA